MKRIACLLLSGAALVAAGCSKNNDSTPSTPPGAKEYDVEVRVTSTSSSRASVLYSNETGGNTTLSGVSLPATFKYKRTLKQFDAVTVVASLGNEPQTADITASLSLDGKVVDAKTARGSNAQASVVYVLP